MRTGSRCNAMLHFIGFTQHDTSEQTLHDYSANVAGELFDLPAGPVGMAVGYEHRDNSGFFEPDPIVAADSLGAAPGQTVVINDNTISDIHGQNAFAD